MEKLLPETNTATEEKARRIIAQELRKLGWKEADFGQRLKSDAGKVRIARRWRRETTVGKRWIAQPLAMGSLSKVTFCLRAGGSH